MSVELLLIPSQFPMGVDVTVRKTVVLGQVLPYNTSNPVLTITAFSIASNVVTFTCANSLTAGGGQTVNVAGLEGALAYLNGQYTTASASATAFTAALTAANVATTQALALATLTPNYATGGIAIGPFVSLKTGLVQGIGTIGPLSVPRFLEVYSLLGTRNYPVNASVQPNLVLSYTLAGVQATNAAALPADSIGFYAEYEKNAF